MKFSHSVKMCGKCPQDPRARAWLETLYTVYMLVTSASDYFGTATRRCFKHLITNELTIIDTCKCIYACTKF